MGFFTRRRKGQTGSVPPVPRTRLPTSPQRGQSVDRANTGDTARSATANNRNQLSLMPAHASHPPGEETFPRRLDPLSQPRHLQGKATTAVSLQDVNAQPSLDSVPREQPPSASHQLSSHHPSVASSGLSVSGSKDETDTADSSSVRSSNVFGFPNPAVPSFFGESTPARTDHTALHTGENNYPPLEEGPAFLTQVDDVDADFENEFDPVDRGDPGPNNSLALARWRKKRKHFFVLSEAGKPIYSRHGDASLISDFIGIIQTIISSCLESDNPLRSLTSHGSRIVILPKGPLYFVAVSRLLESDSQLRSQLEALYMQILCTLTFPALIKIFKNKPSTDLSIPLQGTEPLLSSLVDSFTRGAPSTLLSAMECLKLRKSQRQVIHNILLKVRAKGLLYGLIVAGGRLVSVVRPKKHSLHPGDLQLIFNMIFEADGIKAGGGDSWIPICLPGFNSTGYLHMYVSFLDLRVDENGEPVGAEEESSKDESVAIILICANKEAFYEMQDMRNAFVEQLNKTGSFAAMKKAIDEGRPLTTSIVPGTSIRHFLCKSKQNVQFTMSTFNVHFSTVLERRKLFSVYSAMHANVHSKNLHPKVEFINARFLTALAWVTPTFELYCVAPPNCNRKSLSNGASRIAQWVQRENERLFIIGGAVF